MDGRPESGYGTGRVTIEDNLFDSLSIEGVILNSGGIFVDEFTGNTFTNITSTHNQPTNAGAIALHVFGYREPTYPVIRRARNNTFIGNDIGVKFEAFFYPTGFPGSDFGNDGDPGNNVFRCNGVPAGLEGYWADVMFAMYDLTSPVSFPFVGNEWDHAVPDPITVDFTNPATNTVLGDVLLMKNVSVDTKKARTSNMTCPRGILP